MVAKNKLEIMTSSKVHLTPWVALLLLACTQQQKFYKSLSIRRIQKGNVGNISTEGSVQQPLSPVPEAVTDHARVEVAGASPGHVPDLVTLSSGE